MAFDKTSSYPMCGYMTILTNNNYEGRAVNGSDDLIQNCVHSNLSFGPNEDTMQSLFVITRKDNEGTLTGVITDVTTLYDGIPAIEILVKNITPGAAFHLVDDQWDYNDDWEFDTTRYAAAKGDYVRTHRLTAGESFVVSLDPTKVATYEKGKIVTITGANAWTVA